MRVLVALLTYSTHHIHFIISATSGKIHLGSTFENSGVPWAIPSEKQGNFTYVARMGMVTTYLNILINIYHLHLTRTEAPFPDNLFSAPPPHKGFACHNEELPVEVCEIYSFNLIYW